MASLAQIEANRRNSLQSTGPQTPEGKTRSSQNAYKHGLTAEKAVSHYDDITSFWELEQSFLAQFQPVGSLELHLVRTVISAAWRLQRLQNMEAGLWDLDSIDTRSDAQHYLAEDRRDKLALAFRKNCATKTLPTLSLYEQRLERSFYKSLCELRQLQADRRFVLNTETETDESVVLNETKTQTTCARPRERCQTSLSPQPHNPQIGFVCSNQFSEDEPALLNALILTPSAVVTEP